MISQDATKNNLEKQQTKQPQPQSLESSYAADLGCSSCIVRLSGLFILLIFFISVSISFTLGRYCQSHFRYSIQRALPEKSITSLFQQLIVLSPPPRFPFFLSRDNNNANNTNNVKKDKVTDDDGDDNDTGEKEDEREDDTGVASNGAEQLLVDVTNVDPDFLSSPGRLETALLTLLQENPLNDDSQLLSFHQTQHHLKQQERGGGGGGGGAGVSFTILLLNGNVFLHAWPSIGVLTLDIYKSRSPTTSNAEEDSNREGDVDEEEEEQETEEASLINLVPVIEKLFAIGEKRGGNIDKPPHFYWAMKDRAVNYESGSSDPADSSDYRSHYLGRRAFTHKQQVSVVETPFQTFEVYDVIDIRDAHQKTDRILFLDHVTQSSRLGLEAYHEALVHPALLSHPNPKRVAIVGGGEGATLREVLKHSTVKKVVMIEIDAVMVGASKSALLEWNDCSDLVGSVVSCFDDSRAEVYLQDAVGWFLDRYYKREVPEEEKFDVIIMDAL
jgi:S-adenosylmethionine/arginine decarboxylase-like enzyme